MPQKNGNIKKEDENLTNTYNEREEKQENDEDEEYEQYHGFGMTMMM